MELKGRADIQIPEEWRAAVMTLDTYERPFPIGLPDEIDDKKETYGDILNNDPELKKIPVGLDESEKMIDKIKVVSIAPLFAEAIKRLNEAKPLGDLFEYDK